MSDAEWIAQLKAGSNDAFSQLIRNYKSRIYNSCLGILQNEEEAADVTQEIFIEVWQSVSKFRGESKLSTWLYRMAINRSLDQLRKRKRKKAGILVSLFKRGADEDMYIHEPADFNHPGVLAENRESAAILFAAIDRLPEKQKSAFVLQNLEGMSMKEIAEVMQCSDAAVESLLSRARENLRQMLSAYYERSKKKKK